MWVYEKSREDGINWFLEEYLDRNTLLEQFPYDLPGQLETGALDPKGSGSLTIPALVKATLLAIAVLVALHLLIGAGKQNRIILQKTYNWSTPPHPRLSPLPNSN